MKAFCLVLSMIAVSPVMAMPSQYACESLEKYTDGSLGAIPRTYTYQVIKSAGGSQIELVAENGNRKFLPANGRNSWGGNPSYGSERFEIDSNDRSSLWARGFGRDADIELFHCKPK